jgi:two-component system LytT family sensor kinase
MKKVPDKKLVRFYVLLGLAYGVLWAVANFSNFPGTRLQSAGNNAWRMLYLTVINFIFFEYALAFLAKKRRWLIYNLLLGVLTIVVFSMLWSYGMYDWRLFGIYIHVYAELLSFPSLGKALTAQMAYSVGSVVFFAIIRHIYNYIKLKDATKQLRIEKQEAELNYLRSQTNPHFLFNTLNNIYSLARDKSDLAPESILRLSKILRFMLYETGGDYIAVEQELKIMNDYIALEKLRYDESLHLNFNHDIEDMKQALPPLLLIPLVENAFKHGVSETRGTPFVDIHLSIKNRLLLFVVKNSTERLPGEKIVKENIGLTNLRRQLELLYKDFELIAQQGDSVFTTSLKIKLASHV